MGYTIVHKQKGVRITFPNGNVEFFRKGDYEPNLSGGVLLLKERKGGGILRFNSVNEVDSISDEVNGGSLSVPATLELLLDAVGFFFFKDVEYSGYESPDSSGIYWYENDQETYEAYGRYYLGSKVLQCMPTGWRMPTPEEFEAVRSEVNIVQGGKFENYNGTGFSNLGSYANYWVLDEGVLNQYWDDTAGDVKDTNYGWYPPAQNVVDGSAYTMILVYDGSDDGRGADASVIPITIGGVVYNTQRKSDGLIWMEDPFVGLILPPTKKLTLSPEKILTWEEDALEDHTHPKSDITDLTDFDLRTISGFLPSGTFRWIDATDNDDVQLARMYMLDTINNNIPAGWHLPTEAEWVALVAAAGSTLEVGGSSNKAPISVAAYTALAAGGSLGTNIDHRGFCWLSIDGVYTQAEADAILAVINAQTVQARDAVYGGNWFTGALYAKYQGFVELGNVGLYDGYNSYSGQAGFHTHPNRNVTYLKVRLVKDDSTDPVTVNFGGAKTYDTVKIGTDVWLAEDFEEDITQPATVSLQRVDGQLVFV